MDIRLAVAAANNWVLFKKAVPNRDRPIDVSNAVGAKAFSGYFQFINHTVGPLDVYFRDRQNILYTYSNTTEHPVWRLSRCTR